MKRYQIESCSIQGSAPINEDALVINDKQHIFGVVDGATSILPYKDSNGHTGGKIAADLAASYMEKLPLSSSLKEGILKANTTLRKRMIANGIPFERKEARWGAVFAIVQIRDHYLDFVHAGDCMIFVRYTDGTIRALTHDQLLHIDSQLDSTIANQEPKPSIQNRLITNRQQANTPGGYGVINGDEDLSHFIETGTITLNRVQSCYIITDGFAHLSNDHYHATLDQIDQQGIKQTAQSLDTKEKADQNRTRYPRLKVSDDKSGVVIHFNHN